MYGVINGLLFITHQTEQYTYLESVEIALRGGCKHIQLRMKDVSLDEVMIVAQEAKSRSDHYDACLYINDYVDVCKQIGARGVHLGKTDILPSEARSILGNGFIIGGTANTFADICCLLSEGIDYIGLGPFRFTTTKKNLSPVLGLDGYADILNRCKENNVSVPILAIGGIMADDIPSILQTGVDGIASSSMILKAKNPIDETRFIIEIINNVNRK